MTEESTTLLRSELEAHVLTLTLDRVAKKNALNGAMYDALEHHLARAVDDPDVRVVLLRGHDSVFTAGNDLQDFMHDPPTSYDSPVGRFLDRILSFPKPLLAAVAGPAIGIGTSMLLHCDFVLASDDAVFQLPFTRLGLCPEAASSVLLPALAGHARASELLLFGERFDAAQAKAIGLVNEVLGRADVFERARQRARTLAALPPAAVRETKALIMRSRMEIARAAMLREGSLFFERLASPEAREAMSAFFERRSPDFSRFS